MARWFGSPHYMGYAHRTRGGDVAELAQDLAVEDALEGALGGRYDSGRSVAWLRTPATLEDAILMAYLRAAVLHAAERGERQVRARD